jgi:hypothetical protein
MRAQPPRLVLCRCGSPYPLSPTDTMTLQPVTSVVELLTLDGCRLAIGRYPAFAYNGEGGRGRSELGQSAAGERQMLQFEPSGLRIPPLDRRSARFLGLPLPPDVAVTIEPLRLEGWLSRSTGVVQLRFQSRFQLRLGPRYRAPDLWIDTQLSTEPVVGRRHRASGQPLAADGTAVLVGVAGVAPSGETWLDRFLGLPDEALAVLRCQFR